MRDEPKRPAAGEVDPVARGESEVETKFKPEVMARFRAMAEDLLHARGLALKLLRELELRITQTEAGKQTRRSQQAISKWESGSQVPSIKSVGDYVRRLGCTMALFGRYHALALTMIYGSDMKMEIAFRGRALRVRENIDKRYSTLGVESGEDEEMLEDCEIAIIKNLSMFRRIERKYKTENNTN